MKNINWSNVEENKEFEKVTPGGYICGITAVKDEPEKEYLKVEFDIVEGNLKGYYKELYTNKGFWGGSFIRSYKETALSFFKGFLKAIELSNAGFKADDFDGDETKLRGKLIGLVLAEEEYKGNDGTVKTRIYVDAVHSADRIKKGDFKVPELKKLASTSDNGFFDIPLASDDKLPWE